PHHLLTVFFLFTYHALHPDIHSFPTRRSSDLVEDAHGSFTKLRLSRGFRAWYFSSPCTLRSRRRHPSSPISIANATTGGTPAKSGCASARRPSSRRSARGVPCWTSDLATGTCGSICRAT